MHSLVITIKNSYAKQTENYFNDGRLEKKECFTFNRVCVSTKMCNEWQNRGKNSHNGERDSGILCNEQEKVEHS